MEQDSQKIKTQVFQPVKLERIADKVAAQIKRAITDGVYKIGDRLPSERELSERMGVSRPSVREAIQKLEFQGLIETVQGGGSVVLNLAEQSLCKPIELLLESDPRKVIELTEVRACMEVWASRKAAENHTKEDLKLIGGYLKEMERDFERGAIRAELDFKFHVEIAAASHNIIFLHLMHGIYDLINHSVKMSREQVFITETEQETILRHHKNIFSSIQASDPDAAEIAMNEHLNFVIREYQKRFLAE